MLHFTNKSILLSALVASTLLIGCGSASDATSTVTAATFDGQLVDNYVENADYTCADGSSGITNVNGDFSCKSLPVTFSLAGLKLGQISELNADKQVFPQDLLGVDRNDTQNRDVVAMARFLQSCDEDREPKNGIKIPQHTKDSLQMYNENFDASNLGVYAQDLDLELFDENVSIEHLDTTVELVDALNSLGNLPIELKTALLTTQSTLTQELKDTLSYMGNEERLAYDVYNKLYLTYPDVSQFTNIATRSESTHFQTVQFLVQKYITDYTEFSNIDLPELGYKNVALEDMEAGKYDISAIQNLYNALIEKGEVSKQDALEAACMIEVTDIDDLDRDILLSEAANADDITAAFNFLRDGSYAHYWAFDSGLKAIGVENGCCSAGDEYCKTEADYPKQATQNPQGSGHGFQGGRN